LREKCSWRGLTLILFQKIWSGNHIDCFVASTRQLHCFKPTASVELSSTTRMKNSNIQTFSGSITRCINWSTVPASLIHLEWRYGRLKRGYLGRLTRQNIRYHSLEPGSNALKIGTVQSKKLTSNTRLELKTNWCSIYVRRIHRIY
jgi:hypothetical protein